MATMAHHVVLPTAEKDPLTMMGMAIHTTTASPVDNLRDARGEVLRMETMTMVTVHLLEADLTENQDDARHDDQ